MQFSWFNLAVILFLSAGALFGLAPLIGATLLAPRSKGGDIGLPYECGITPHGPARVRFGINYYFYALLFLAFDVDVLYLFPVAAFYPAGRSSGSSWSFWAFWRWRWSISGAKESSRGRAK